MNARPAAKRPPAPIAARGPTQRPCLAIIVPVYRHSELAMEALECALAEAEDVDGVVVIVNDGCPWPQTDELAASFSESWPRRVVYLRTRNAGLSAARNRGIRHALARFPSVEAVYLLDADNRLHRGAMRRALAAMRDRGAGWVYPSIDMVGQEMNFDHSQPYSLLRHIFQNLCEAGSLVSRRVFEAGIFFDENMKLGWEDWEFWLRCGIAGFRGVGLAEFGLQYRARRESMLRDSDRRAAEISLYMRTKHKALFGWREMLRLEHTLAPRFCTVDARTRQFQFGSVPGQWSQRGALEELPVRFWRHDIYPTHAHFPDMLVFGHGAILSQLSAAGLLDWVYWQAQDLGGVAFVTLSVHPAGVAVTTGTGPGAADAPHLIAISHEAVSRCVKDADETWLATLGTPESEAELSRIAVAGPFDAVVLDDPAARGARDGLRAMVALIRDAASRPDASQPWEWRDWSNIQVDRVLHRMVAKELHASGPIARTALADKPELAIVLPVASFGGVEQVALHVARAFRAAGWTARLVVTGANEVANAGLLRGAVDSIGFLNDPSAAGFNRGGNTYFGHNLQSWSKTGRIERLIGLLTGCAAVIGFQSLHVNEAMGWLRRNGTVAITSLHVIDHDMFGAPAGHPYLHLPYEHAYDLVTAPSRALLRFCAGAGVPAAKLLLLENAPTFVPTADMLERRRAQLAHDAQRPAASPLRALYLGRLDRQKGAERLLGAIRRTRAAAPGIQWRVVGAAVVREGAGDWTAHALASLGITPEPAVYERPALIERLLWADVLVLPSRWEGSPIIIREAQSLGAVPVATNVGAVDEMIAHDADGWLLREGADTQVAAALAAALVTLARDRARLRRLAEGGMTVTAGLTWARTAAPLLAAVERLRAR